MANMKATSQASHFEFCEFPPISTDFHLVFYLQASPPSIETQTKQGFEHGFFARRTALFGRGQWGLKRSTLDLPPEIDARGPGRLGDLESWMGNGAKGGSGVFFFLGGGAQCQVMASVFERQPIMS